jgi:UDP-N-acetylglucosamine--N-acetylmuramyl-(pentapeptide) pyrophosphoryl-undecaprenol N-acetylglucosamine transferase
MPYLHDMSDALAASDLVISRAGATAIAEFLVRGLPMVLVPFPYAAGDHQRLNARAVADQGAALVIEDQEFSADKFLSLISDEAVDYAKMKQASAAMAKPDAAERIVDHIYGRS